MAEAPDAEKINIKVRAQNGSEVHFTLKKTTRMEKLMVAYCTRIGQDINAMRFMFDGERISREDTPMKLNLEDGDVIDAMLPQVGGSFNMNH